MMMTMRVSMAVKAVVIVVMRVRMQHPDYS
jgi:hypothetical protein